MTPKETRPTRAQSKKEDEIPKNCMLVKYEKSSNKTRRVKSKKRLEREERNRAETGLMLSTAQRCSLLYTKEQVL